MTTVVLDAAAFDVLDSAQGAALRALLERAVQRGGDVRTPSVVLAEVCRGSERTRRVETALAGRRGPRIRTINTDPTMAKMVGAILHHTGSDSTMLADAHVVAACTAADSAVVITADPGDINGLASAVPATRIVTRRPSLA